MLLGLFLQQQIEGEKGLDCQVISTKIAGDGATTTSMKIIDERENRAGPRAVIAEYIGGIASDFFDVEMLY